MNLRKLLKSLQGSQTNVRFGDRERLTAGFGFRRERSAGSHRVFVHPAIPELLNLQEVEGQAKPYPNQAIPEARRKTGLAVGARRMSDYHINVFPSAEDGGWIADIPDLACCSAFGATPQEALAEALQAQAAWLDAARSAGKPIPQPQFRPAIYLAG